MLWRTYVHTTQPVFLTRRSRPDFTFDSFTPKTHQATARTAIHTPYRGCAHLETNNAHIEQEYSRWRHGDIHHGCSPYLSEMVAAVLDARLAHIGFFSPTVVVEIGTRKRRSDRVAARATGPWRWGNSGKSTRPIIWSEALRSPISTKLQERATRPRLICTRPRFVLQTSK